MTPSFPLEAFTRILDQAFPASAKAGCRAFSRLELSDEIANSVRIVQPSGEEESVEPSGAAPGDVHSCNQPIFLSNPCDYLAQLRVCAAEFARGLELDPLLADMPASTRGSLQVLDLQGGAGGAPRVVLRAAASEGAATDAPAGAVAGGDGSGHAEAANASEAADVVAGVSGDEDPFAVGLAISGARRKPGYLT